MKQLITLLAGVVFCYTAFATTFTVTSNADSGPGTLREAITMANANGNAVTEYIYFNIPQPVLNMRMIELVTELPSISSNIIIDGTTQPGDFYGTTDAKVCIKKNDYAPEFSMLKVENAQGVEIYGMCFIMVICRAYFRLHSGQLNYTVSILLIPAIYSWEMLVKEMLLLE